MVTGAKLFHTIVGLEPQTRGTAQQNDPFIPILIEPLTRCGGVACGDNPF